MTRMMRLSVMPLGRTCEAIILSRATVKSVM
jgi:hypothetical protein